jgi:hypothetical protein
MLVARSGHTATLLPNGRVLILGGFDGNAVLNSAEVFDPTTRAFVSLPARLTVPRTGHTATLINDRFRVAVLSKQYFLGNGKKRRLRQKLVESNPLLPCKKIEARCKPALH